MPQRTIAAGGGNFSSTATWVEGAVPTASDFVVGNASSGQLTLDGNYTVQTIDMSTYTNTFTLNATRIITLSSATTISFGVSTTFAGTGTINLGSGSQTISSLTTSRIPNLIIPGGTKTLTNNLYITNFTFGTTGSPQLVGSGFDVFVNGNFFGAFGGVIQTGVDVILDGTGTLETGGLTMGGTGRLIMNTSGTITWTGQGLSLLDNAHFVYTSGTTVNPFIRYVNQASSTLTLYTSGMTWDSINFWTVANNPTTTFALFENLNCSIFTLSLDRGSSAELTQFTQTGRLNITNQMVIQANTGNAAGLIRLSTGVNHSINKIFALATPLFKYTIRSATNGVRANLNLGDKNNSPIFYINFTDIDGSSGQEIRTYDSTVSNCVNVSNYTSTIFGGGGASAYTFIS